MYTRLHARTIHHHVIRPCVGAYSFFRDPCPFGRRTVLNKYEPKPIVGTENSILQYTVQRLNYFYIARMQSPALVRCDVRTPLAYGRARRTFVNKISELSLACVVAPRLCTRRAFVHTRVVRLSDPVFMTLDRLMCLFAAEW